MASGGSVVIVVRSAEATAVEIFVDYSKRLGK